MSNYIEKPRYSCALGGAIATVTALPDTIPILHATAGCAGNFTWTQSGGCALQIGGHCGGLSIPSSNVQETEIVFGGTDRLLEQVKSTIEIMDGKLYVVLSSCLTEMIGDDVSAITEFNDDSHKVISANTAGFRGNSYIGYNAVLESLIKDFITKDVQRIKKTVNLWGVVPNHDVFWRGNLIILRNLLNKLGIKVNTFFTYDDTLEDIKNASSAELNVIVSDVYGFDAAELFEEEHGTPFVQTSFPIGPSETDSFLRTIGNALSIKNEVIEQIINSENDRYYKLLEPLTDAYNDLEMQRYTIVVGDANYSYSLTKFLSDDLGWISVLSVCTDPLLDTQKDNLLKRFDKFESKIQPDLIFETNTSKIIEHLGARWPLTTRKQYFNSLSPSFVVGSSLDRDLASSIGAGHLSVSFPVSNRVVINKGYAGYSGGLHLIEDLLGVIIAGR